MADTKITALTADATPDATDLLLTVDDVAGTPTNKKATISNVLAVNDARTKTLTNTTINADGTGNVITNIGASEVKADIISGQTLVTAVGSDHVAIVDATDGLLKKALISDFASAGGDMAAATYDPATIAQQVVGLTATQTLTNKTLTSPVLNTGVSGTAVLDEDNMVSNSATQLATQQSIKAYADTKQVAGATLTSLEGLTLNAGDLLYATAADTLVDLPIGTANQELRVNAGATAPEWYTPSAGGGQTLVTRIVAPSGGDHTTLQDALTAASAGDTIYVRAGTYALVANTTSTLANIRIVGENAQTSIISLVSYGLTLSGANATIENLKFIGSSASSGQVKMSGADATFRNNWALSANTTDTFVYFAGTRAKVYNNLFQTSATTNVNMFLTEGTHTSVINNKFVLAGVGTSVNNPVIYIIGANSAFNQNYIYSSGGVNSSGFPCVRVSGQWCTLSGNTITQALARMTAIYSSSAQVIITGNTMHLPYTGIDIITTDGTITGNYIYGTNASGYGIHLQGSSITCSGNTIQDSGSTGNAIRVTGDYNVISDNVINNGRYGVRLASGADGNTVSGNSMRLNNANMIGVDVLSLANSVTGNAITGFSTAGGVGINVNNLNNSITSNLLKGMQSGLVSDTSATYCTFTSNNVDSCTNGFTISSNYSVWTGNTARNTTNDIVYGTHNKSNTVRNNQADGINEINETKIVWMKNTSGGALAAGDVVVIKAVAAGNEITTTTTGGDDKVYGVCTEAILDTAFGPIQTLGKTTLLKVNGTTDIAIGDFLTTFTTAGIAQKATAGDMCFGMALEAYITDDSSGVIDALLFTPRLI